VKRAGDHTLAYSGQSGKFSDVALAVAMPPHARSDGAQAMSGVLVLIVEEKLLADRLFKETVFTCSW